MEASDVGLLEALMEGVVVVAVPFDAELLEDDSSVDRLFGVSSWLGGYWS